MIVISYKSGQLANRLFAFAHFIAFAKEHKITVINFSFEEYAVFFENTANNLLLSYPNKIFFSPPKCLKKGMFYLSKKTSNFVKKIKINNSLIKSITLENSIDVFDLEEERSKKIFLDTQIIFVNGWLFRSNNNFEKHSDLIRSFFKPIYKFRKDVDIFIDNLKKKHMNIVGIHIRRGDYKNFEGGKFFYSLETYLKIKTKTKKLLGKQTFFIVCSDEILPSNFLKKNGLYQHKGHFVEDLYLLSKCDFILGPPSTFSMWASFYGKKPLYMIKNPDKDFKMEDFSIVKH